MGEPRKEAGPDERVGLRIQQLINSPDFDWVLYVLGLRTADGRCTFLLLSAHLNPKQKPRRAHDVAAIGQWTKARMADQAEKDFIVLGDSHTKLQATRPKGFVSLNDTCKATDVSPSGPKPYDQVFFDPNCTTEIDQRFGFQVVSLIEAMRSRWTKPMPFPGEPYQDEQFRGLYSYHNPVLFRIRMSDHDDD